MSFLCLLCVSWLVMFLLFVDVTFLTDVLYGESVVFCILWHAVVSINMCFSN